MSDSNRKNSPLSGLRAVLDVTATIVVIALGTTLIWMQVASPQSRSQAATRPEPAARPELPLPPEPLSFGERSVLGSTSARAAMVVYSDFQCPFCAKFSREQLPTLLNSYVKAGKIALEFRHLPLEIHPQAFRAAEGAECAARQGRFWPMHDLLFEDPRELQDEGLYARAARIGISPATFRTCLTSGATAARVKADVEEANRLQVRGTPTFFLGVRDGNSLKVLKRVSGAQPLDRWKSILDPLIEKASAR